MKASSDPKTRGTRFSEATGDLLWSYAKGPGTGRWSGSWQPLTQATYVFRPDLGAKEPSAEAWLAYFAVCNLREQYGVDPHAFVKDLRSIMNQHGGYDDPKKMGEAIQRAQDAHLLFRVHKGTGLPHRIAAFYALVGAGETLQSAFDAAVYTEAWKARLALLDANGLARPDYIVAGGRIIRSLRAAA